MESSYKCLHLIDSVTHSACRHGTVKMFADITSVYVSFCLYDKLVYTYLFTGQQRTIK